MIFTFKINTTTTDNLNKIIQDYLTKHNLDLPKADIQKLSFYIHDKSYMFVDEVQASNEESSWEKIDDTRLLEELEITEISDEDEQEAEQRAKDRWEALEEDRYMDYVRGID